MLADNYRDASGRIQRLLSPVNCKERAKSFLDIWLPLQSARVRHELGLIDEINSATFRWL